jgi:hypothetical protein
VQWVIKVIKEKAEAAERARNMPTEEEQEARRRAWREQTRTPTPPPASTPTAGGMLEDLMGELSKALHPPPQPKPPKLPPPMPKAATAPAAAHRSLAPRESAPLAVPSTIAPLQSLRAEKQPHPLTSLLRTPGGYQQAFVLKEVLGPPRALQEYNGPD